MESKEPRLEITMIAEDLSRKAVSELREILCICCEALKEDDEDGPER